MLARRRWLAGLLLVVTATALVQPQAAPAEKDPIKNAVRNLYDITYVPVQSPIMAKIFSASFYQVTSKLAGGNMVDKLLVASAGDKVFLLEDTTTTHPMPNFLATIKKDFKLKSDEDAALFENTLDRLYPMGGHMMSQEDQAAKAIKRTSTSVTFIRGAFFKNRKGFVLSLGPDGNITGITYALDLKP